MVSCLRSSLSAERLKKKCSPYSTLRKVKPWRLSEGCGTVRRRPEPQEVISQEPSARPAVEERCEKKLPIDQNSNY
jgi:hypothetical protein